ncbi:MAG TPA: DNA methyltransferase, partial [Bacillota bacterium]|nr:DNA methyltransferase [Bacillota bacterium]
MKRGDHKIFQGDCLKVMKKLPSDSVDLIFTDPPYNRGIKYVKKDFKDRKTKEKYLEWMKERLKEMHRLLKPT